MDELESLITTLTVEVGQQWDAQIQIWQDAMVQAQQQQQALVPVVPASLSDRGKAVAEPSNVQPVPVAVPSGEGSSVLAELAQVQAERDEARRQLQEVRSQKARAKSQVSRQKDAIQQLCFWLSHCGHSFALHLPPSPPW